MDGNGRWASQRGLPRVAGHRAGAESLRKAIRTAVEHGVEALTVYAFSSENWRRSSEEISDLTSLMRYYLERELATFEKEGVRLQIIGDFSAFGSELAAKLSRAVERTSGNRRITLVVALNYGSQAEIAAAARKLAERARSGAVDPADICPAMLEAELQTANLPELDLLIRTSGEERLSNFLLWQAAYAELVFLDTLWPDFDEATFTHAIEQYRGRHRRFGGR
ncbi:di-trans,poly-cis-decaprenylcistransferase [Sphingomonas piscis]|uniref:Isoprenyl transferase n=2 Tax=Sphingomonas piscis TaxID=2714943 RepID=A0A6G7YSX1_9SPHN|nr:polyprenyl diphosphate synthase [Sphingomonas piscis]QIK79832.1 di-trans,poly-cis-decaprenylcistransferase [Sphingomonas piscis]